MAILSNINDKFAVDSTGAIQFNGQAGTLGYVLKSNGNAAPTWVDASTIIGGPYLPLSGGTLTGNLAINGSNSLTVGGVLNGTSATFSGNVRISKTDATLEINNSTGSLTNADLYISVEDTGQADVRQYGAYPLAFWTNNAERMRIDSSGNLSLATATSLDFNVADFAQIKFRESGAITIDSDNDQSSRNFAIKDGDGTNLLTVFDTGNSTFGGEVSLKSRLNLQRLSGGATTLIQFKNENGVDRAHIDFGGTNEELSFFAGAGTVENMRIDSSGNVGIRTDSPQTLLNVNSLSGTTYPTLGTASGVIAISINELHGMYLGVDGSSGNGWIQAMREDATATAYNLILQPSGGNVGIGITAPLHKLHVDGSTQLGRNGNNTAGDPQKTLISGQGIEDAATGNFYGSYGFLELNANNNYTGSARRIAITNGLLANRFAIIRSDTNMGPMQLGVGGAVPTGAVADFVIDTSGKVGIGTTSPDAKLHIYGSASLSEMYLGEDASADKAGILKYTQGNGSGTGVITLSHWGNNSLTEGLAVKYGGNVGIGTTSPVTKLSNTAIRNASASGLSTSILGLNWEVPAGANSQGYIASFANTQTAAANANAGVLIEVGSTDTTTRLLSVESGGVNRFEVRGDGNVGIGTASPSGPFHVKVGTSTPLIVASSSYCNNVGIRTTTPTASLQVKGNVSYSYNNYTNVATTWVNVFNMASYPTGLYQVSIIKKTNASAYITAIIKWDATASASTAGTIVNTITSNQLGVSFNGSTTLQSISALATGTLMSANLQCLVTNEDFCS